MRGFQVLLLSFFGTGYSPIAPGTVGSLATLPLVYLAWTYSQISLDIALFFIILGISLVTIKRTTLGHKDPSWVVIDEVLGMFIAYICVSFFKYSLFKLIIIFLVFRGFDIVKPPPISNIDKMTFPEAIIWDDIVAGIFAGLLSGIIFYIFPQI